MGLLSNTPEDHPVVLVAQPEPGLSKVIELRTDGRNQLPILGHAVDAGRADDVGAPAAEAARMPSLSSISKACELNSTASTMLRSRRNAGQFAGAHWPPTCSYIRDGKPRRHGRRHRVGHWQVDSAHCDFLMDCSRDDYLSEEHAEKVEIAEGSQINKRAGIGDDQELSDRAPSLEFIDGRAVGVPVICRVDNIRGAAMLQQFHESETFETEFVRGLASRDSAVRKKG
jgi:hypothetical protein